MKFKAGDEVQPILSTDRFFNEIGIISQVRGQLYDYYVTFSNNKIWPYDEDELKFTNNHIFNNCFEENLK